MNERNVVSGAISVALSGMAALGADFINSPELLEQPEWAVKSACWWWAMAGLNQIAG